MALSKRDCRHGRQIGKCADCDYQRAPTSGATLRSMIEGMSVSVDVSTGDHDAGHRYFGTVTEVMECQGNKHGVTLLVQDAEPNFTATPTAPQPSPTAQADSGFDYKTAADFLSGKTVSDEAVRKFVAVSRWAHEERAALSATLLAMHGVLTSREAEIALLKQALLEAEAAPQQEAQGLVLEGYTLPPLSEPDLRDVGTKPQDIKDFLRGYATEYAKRALRLSQPAPAPLSDDVLEKAARYDLLRDCDLDDMAAKYWPGGQVPTGDEFDVAIGAALAAQRGSK